MQLQRLLDLSEINDGDVFQRELIDLAASMDFGLVTGIVVVEVPGASPHVVRLGNVPEAFVEASMDMDDSARDPVLQKLKTLSVPVIYDQSTYVRGGVPDLWDQQAQFGFHTGIAVCLHLPGNRHFVLGLNRERALPKDEARLVRMLGDLQLLTVHAQQTALRLYGQPLTPIKLSAREQLVLRMTIDGKTSKVIARELVCAEVTVNFHLKKISKKLGVSSRHQAARRAQALGLI